MHDKDRYWDPFFAACEETGTVINMHIGSSSKMPSTSEDAPAAVGSTLTFANSCYSLVDWLMCGVFTRFPKLKIAFSEGSIGWIPYVLHRADVVWEENRGWGGVADTVKRAAVASSTTSTCYGCFFDDPHGLLNIDAHRRQQRRLMRATTRTRTPPGRNTRAVAEEQMKHLDRDVVEKIVRGNAIRLSDLSPEGRWGEELRGRRCWTT